MQIRIDKKTFEFLLHLYNAVDLSIGAMPYDINKIFNPKGIVSILWIYTKKNQYSQILLFGFLRLLVYLKRLLETLIVNKAIYDKYPATKF